MSRKPWLMIQQRIREIQPIVMTHRIAKPAVASTGEARAGKLSQIIG